MKLIIQTAKAGLDVADEQVIEVGEHSRLILRKDDYHHDRGWTEYEIRRWEGFDEDVFLEMMNRCRHCSGKGYYFHGLKGHLETCHDCGGTGKDRRGEPGSRYAEPPRR